MREQWDTVNLKTSFDDIKRTHKCNGNNPCIKKTMNPIERDAKLKKEIPIGKKRIEEYWQKH